MRLVIGRYHTGPKSGFVAVAALLAPLVSRGRRFSCRTFNAMTGTKPRLLLGFAGSRGHLRRISSLSSSELQWWFFGTVAQGIAH